MLPRIGQERLERAGRKLGGYNSQADAIELVFGFGRREPMAGDAPQVFE